MAKFPVEWHRQCLTNAESSLAEDEKKLARYAADVDRARARVKFMRRQIAEADARGLDGFDPERLLIPRRAAQS